ncbi:hypothetical protein [Thalassotalea crassostreae]|uniref:hypothetical protein n=1 Tax=Thalassotalea crassostreae TaxID=1763536 RepID=UPI0008385A9A|nr:hypothetical protein [Thalassotalea crassostreae]
MKNLTEKNAHNEQTEQEEQKLDSRRNFIKKYGKLAVVTPVAVTALMTPKTSHAMNSDGASPSTI